MKTNRKLTTQLESDVRELCQPSGRRVGTNAHQAAEQWIVKRLNEIGCVPYKGDSFDLPYQADGLRFANFAGVIPGSNRNLPPILIGAHYDSVIDAPCADDNGASVAISLAVAQHVKTNGGLERDFLIVLFDAEEPPFFQTEWMGSNRFYEDEVDERGIHFALISDLVGHDVTFPESVLGKMPFATLLTASFKPLTFLTGVESHQKLPQLLDEIKTPNGMKLIATLNRYVGDMSDHGIFRQNKVPYVFLSCGRWEHYHKPTDTPDRLNYAKMAAITQYCINIFLSVSRTRLPAKPNETNSLTYEIKTWKKALGLMRVPLAKILGVTDFNSRENITEAARKLSSLGL